MKNNLYKYTQCFTSFTSLKNSTFSLMSLKNTTIILLLAIAARASECEEVSSAENMNTFIFTKKEKDFLCNELNISYDAIRKNISELVKYNIIEKIDSKTYRLNPFLFVSGKKGPIDRCRAFCEESGKSSFVHISKNQTKFSFIFNSIENLKKFKCFTGEDGTRVINKTELAVFLMLSSEVKDCKFPKTPETCNVIEINKEYYKRLSKTLGLDIRSVQRAISSLCDMHLMHKFEGIDCKYMINPYIAAKGTMEEIRALQIELMDKKYQNYFGGCAEGDTNKKESKIEIINIKSL